MPGLYRKKCKACQHDNHFNSNKCKQCGGVFDIPSEGSGVSVVHVTCSYGYEWGKSKYQATGVSSGQEAPKKTASLYVLRVQHYNCAFHCISNFNLLTAHSMTWTKHDVLIL